MNKKIAILSIMSLITLLGLTQVRHILAGPMAQETTPLVTHGPISGEVTANSVVLWARGNLSGTLLFELSETEAFTKVMTVETDITADNDFTGETTVPDLATDQTYFYRVSLTADEVTSEPVTGQFQTAPAEAAPFDFVFGACLGGQGYCRDPQTGWQIFEAMAAEEPDFFLITGDSIYISESKPRSLKQWDFLIYLLLPKYGAIMA